MPKRKIVSLVNVSAFFLILSYSRKTLVGGISIELKDFTLLNLYMIMMALITLVQYFY